MRLFTRYAVVDEDGSWSEPTRLRALRSVAWCWLAWSMMNGSLYTALLDLMQTTTELWVGLLSWFALL